MPKPKTICFVIDAWFPKLGGGQDRVLNFANQLSQNYQVAILTRNLGSFDSSLLHPKVNLIQLGKQPSFANPLARVSFVFQALKYLLQHNFDLIDFQPYSPWLTAWFYRKLKSDSALVITVLGTGNQVIGMPWLLQPVFKKIYHYLLYKTAWPLIISDTHQAVKNIQSPSVRVVPNAVDLNPFNFKVKPTQAKTIVFLGRFHHQKGIDILLPAFKQVLAKHPQANLILIGSGTELASIKAIIKNLNLSKKVSLPGQITGKKLIKTLKQAKIFVLPSRFEGQAISLLLAMAAKLPIVATKIGDNHKLIKSGKTGYLVNPENIQQLSLALTKLLDQPLKAKKMAAAGYQLVKNQYTWPKTTKKLIQAYQSIFK